METEDGTSNAGANLGAPEPGSLPGGGRNGILDDASAGVGSDVERKENTTSEGGVLEGSQVAAVGLGATRNSVFEGDGEKNRMLVQSAAESTEVSTCFAFSCNQC